MRAEKKSYTFEEAKAEIASRRLPTTICPACGNTATVRGGKIARHTNLRTHGGMIFRDPCRATGTDADL
jgi:hypothetical protein